MRRFNTAAALCALTLTASTAHAVGWMDNADELEVCTAYDYLTVNEVVSEDFGDGDFGGHYYTVAGLYAPVSDAVGYWCFHYSWNSVGANMYTLVGATNEARPYQQQMWLAERMIEDTLDEDPLDGVHVKAKAGADVTLFGHTEDVFSARGKVEADGGELSIAVMGTTLVDEAFGLTYEDDPYVVTFFSAYKGVNLGIFELSARAELAGTLGAEAELSVVGSGLDGNVTPYARLDVTAEAILDILFASAGVTGSLDLLNVRVPIDAGIDADGWSLDAGLVITALDGVIEIFGELFGATARETIAEWQGLTLYRGTLFAEGGDF